MSKHILATTPPFSLLPEDEIEHLQSALPIINIDAGEFVLREGHSDDKFYILVDGQVEIIKSLGKDDERFLGLRSAGTLLGEMSLFSPDGCHSASVRALTRLSLLKISREDLDALLKRHPKMAYEVIRMFSRRLQASENMTILDLRAKNERLRVAYEELKAAQEQIIEKERLEKELEIASEIQRSILPEKLPMVEGYDMGALMVPARHVGGDFYTFFELDKDRLGMVVGDVCDKGVPASLFMALSYSLIRAEALRNDSPVNTLKRVNSHLLEMNSMNLYITLVYGILNINSGDFHFTRMAHPSPVLLDARGQGLDSPISPGQPLGLFTDPLMDEQTIQLPQGGMLVLYSDGVSEPENCEGCEFGIASLMKSLRENRKKAAQEICQQIYINVQAFSNESPQQDDFTMVVVKKRG